MYNGKSISLSSKSGLDQAPMKSKNVALAEYNEFNKILCNLSFVVRLKPIFFIYIK